MIAARRNRIRLRITLLVTIVALVIGAIISLEVAHLQLVRINAALLSNPQSTTESTNWLEMAAAFGEEMIQLFISVTSETN